MQGREMCRAWLKCMRGWTGSVEIHGERCDRCWQRGSMEIRVGRRGEAVRSGGLD